MSRAEPEPVDIAADLRHLSHCQRRWTELWHTDAAELSPSGLPPRDSLEALAHRHHRANFDLWHQEDRARDPASTDADIARIKRAIDQLNQQRNDLTEQIDEHLLSLAGPQRGDAPLHSETPGAMLDRLSILALKLFHTVEEIRRPAIGEAHRTRNRDRLAQLEHQHADLAQCLVALWADVEAGRRRFQLYRQLKMYNDPDLNPVLYRQRNPQPAAAEPPSHPPAVDPAHDTAYKTGTGVDDKKASPDVHR